MNHYVGCRLRRRHAAGLIERSLSFLNTVGTICLVLAGLHSLTGCGEQQSLAALVGQPETNAKTSSGPTDRASGDESGAANEEPIKFVDLDEGGADSAQADDAGDDLLGKDTPRAVGGRLLIKFKAGVGEADKHRVIRNANAAIEREIPQIGVKVLRLPLGANETALMHAFRRRADVDFAEPDYLYEAALIPNDPWYVDPITPQWHLPRIGAPLAWDISTGSSSVTIAVIDTGVYGAHVDLAPKMVGGWNFFDDNSNSSDITGHGTAVAGQGAAASNNGVGVASPAWGCKIMPLRVTDAGGMALGSAIAEALVWAGDNGARIANVSFEMYDSATVTTAAQYLESRGGVAVLSAGNSGTVDPTPDNPHFLKVSATDKSDLVPSWSVTGESIDVAAPGVGIITTNRNGTYSSGTGTSASAPIVSGIAALMISANPSLSSTQVKEILEQSADDLGPAGWDPKYGWGRVNAGRAVQMARDYGGTPSDTTAPTVSLSSPGGGAVVGGTISIGANAADNVGVASVTMSVDGVDMGTDSTSPFSFAWNTTTAINGAHTLRTTARDAAGNWAYAQISVTVDNAAPSVAWSAPASGAFVSGTAPLTASASDNLSVASVVFAVDGTTLVTDASAPYSASWNSATASNGVHLLSATALDMAGNTSHAQLSVTVDNAAPTVSFASPLSGATVSEMVSVQVNAGDNLGIASVSLSVDGLLLGTDSSAPYSLTWDTTTASDGSHTLTATARDLAGNTVSVQINVTVSNAPPTGIDTNPPSISIRAPSDGAVVSRTVSVTVSASDDVGVVEVGLYVDGVLAATSITPPFTNKWNPRKAAKGGHTLRCTAYDAAGNAGYSQTVTVYK